MQKSQWPDYNTFFKYNVTSIRKSSIKRHLFNVHDCKCSISMPVNINKLVKCREVFEDNRDIDEKGWNLEFNRDIDEHRIGID